MFVSIVHVKVKPEFVDDFIRASEKNHLQSVKEAGNLRFDILQKEGEPSEFSLYEAYADKASSAAHKETAHYLEWRETVASWMAAPREGIPYKGLMP